MTISDLPTLNACLNGLTTILITLGWLAIRRKKRETHKKFMLGAIGSSALFLASYLTYHFNVVALTKFPESYPTMRTVYLGILLTHTVLAAIVVPLVLVTAWAALTDRIDRHRRIARWTMPIWWYVSITGVLIYFMLYHWFPN